MSREILLSERFRQAVRAYPKPVRLEIGKAIDRLQSSLGQPHHHSGLGLRKLTGSYFEIRAGLDLRLIFKVEPNAVIFIFAGTHDEVRRFLKKL